MAEEDLLSDLRSDDKHGGLINIGGLNRGLINIIHLYFRPEGSDTIEFRGGSCGLWPGT